MRLPPTTASVCLEVPADVPHPPQTIGGGINGYGAEVAPTSTAVA
jgi:hypothetical protein